MMDVLRGFCALEGAKEESVVREPGVYRKRDGTGWPVSQAPRPMNRKSAPTVPGSLSAALPWWSTTVH